jgi:hypothetical protein
VFFVTRLKDNAAYEVVESAIGPLPRNILADDVTIRDLCRRSSHANFRLVSRIPFGVRS